MNHLMALCAAAIVSVLFFTLPLYAQETQPGESCSINGVVRDTGGPEQLPRRLLICNGSAWQTLMEQAVTGKSLLQIDYDSGGCTTAKTGRLRFNGTNIWEYCNGSAWVPFEQSGSADPAGPADCPHIGDQCTDTTIYAGYHPTLQEWLFLPPADQGTTSRWKTSTGTNDIATDSIDDGRINANQVANSTIFPAFKLCKDLTTGGHTDWYLPSQVELYYLWSARVELNAGPMEDFNSSFYWSSTEYSLNTSWIEQFANGYQDEYNKTDDYRVRCVRR